MRTPRLLLAVLAVLALVAASCANDDDAASPETTPPPDDTTPATPGDATDGEVVMVFSPENNNLVVYEADPPFASQVLYYGASEEHPDGTDVNGQVCFWEDVGEVFFVAGEDTNQPNPPPGWGIFDLRGDRVGELESTQVGRLVPTYQEVEGFPENYGCGVLSDGRLAITDIGNQALGPGNGQLHIWFPPFDSFDVAYCKLDTGIATAQSIWVDGDDNIFVASARGDEENPAGVYRFSPPFPTSDDPEGGCGQVDNLGSPLADEVNGELWIGVSEETGLATPTGLAPAPDGGLYVSSVFNGVINEYDANGEFVRTILEPPADETIGEESYSTGTPLGIAVGPDGTIYYADIGIVVPEGELPGPGSNTGSLRRIVFVDGEPQAPETMADGLAFPDGLGVYVPGRVGGSGSSVPPS